MSAPGCCLAMPRPRPAVPIDADKLISKIAIAVGYLADASYQKTLTTEQDKEVHRSIVALGALQMYCEEVVNFGAIRLILDDEVESAPVRPADWDGF
jgi:hypothetical protein